MPVMGPHINDDDPRVEEAYAFIMGYLKEGFGVQKFSCKYPFPALRVERNDEFKRALWKLFELESWESW